MTLRGAIHFDDALRADIVAGQFASVRDYDFCLVVDGWIKPPVAAGSPDEAWPENGVPSWLRHAVGDYALVSWSTKQNAFWLARSPLSSRPLFYRASGEGSVAFSSLAADLAGPGPRCDLDAIARWYGALVGTSVDCMFAGVDRVEPGTLVRFDRSGRSVVRFWDARGLEVDDSASELDLATSLRSALEAAVTDSLAGSPVGSLLSAGRDSGCVTAMAAHRLRGTERELHSFTASPGTDDIFHAGDMLMDEVPGAAAVAERHLNIRHHVVTPRGVRFCEAVEQVYTAHSAPLGNPLSLYWWLGIQRQAADLGVTSILTGGMGNLTISDGGPGHLAELFSHRTLGRWREAAREVKSFEGASWLNILHISAGGVMPRPIYSLLQRAWGRYLPSPVSGYLKGELRDRVVAFHRRQDQRPSRRPRRLAQDMLATMELGDISADLLFGISMRDPTADRRVVEAMFAVPPERLVSRYDRRPIFELAFGDLLPKETIRSPRRAFQSMDWNFAYDVPDLQEGLRRYSTNALVAEHLDIDAMARGLARWPVGRLASFEETMDIGEGLFRAFALAAFFHVHFPD